MHRTVMAMACVVLVAALAAPQARAQDGERRRDLREKRKDLREKRRDMRKDNRKERRDMRKGNREERRDLRNGTREERRDMRKDNRKERHEMRKEHREDRKEMREDRKELREERRDMRKEHRADRRERRGDRRERRMERRRKLLGRIFVSGMQHRGNKVVIRGRHFGPKVMVHIGDTMVEAKISGDRIAFRPPAGAKGAVVLHDPDNHRKIFVGRLGGDDKVKRDRAYWKKRRSERMTRARARWMKRRAKLAKTAEERRKAHEEAMEARRQSREERRRQRAEALRAQWQAAFLADADVQAEFALHGQRMARLKRMRNLADIDGREKLVLRIEVLIEREDERHKERLDLLKANIEI